jgi:alkylated DNA repair dioxygenase AlkB
VSAAQLSLFGREEPAIGKGFLRLQRVELGRDSWLEYAPEFVAGDLQLFAALCESMQFRQERRVMYEREVDVPRLYASFPDDGPAHPLLLRVRELLAERYRATIDRIGIAHYRDGRDSVAWHRDHMPRDRPTLVATLSLGTPRRFLLRPFGGGSSRVFSLGAGDLFVMGGMCQANWEHCVPKRRLAAPRMSCMFRHVYEAELPTSDAPRS